MDALGDPHFVVQSVTLLLHSIKNLKDFFLYFTWLDKILLKKDPLFDRVTLYVRDTSAETIRTNQPKKTLPT
jgi:hypothetical protein